MRKLIPVIFLFFCASKNLSAQAVSKPKLPADLVSFFSGRWEGEGEFSNGKKIAADVSFTLSLDSNWLVYDHTDKAPNRFKAHSLWGVERNNGPFVAFLFDNFGSNRKFTSNGWKDGRIILATHDYNPTSGVVYQHFIYEKLSDTSFKMTWETSKDDINWKMGDYLIFKKI